MPQLRDIISPEVKNKLKKIKNTDMNSNTIKGKLGSGAFVGATPDLNSSLGMNSADGAIDTGSMDSATPPVEQSKLSTFWEKNSTFLTGLGSAILGGGSASTPPAPLPEEKKKGIPTWAWILIAIVVIVIIILVVKKMRKG